MGKYWRSLTNGAHVTESVRAGRVFVDGLGGIEEEVLRDRRHMAEDGLVVAIVGIAQQTGELLTGPDLLSRGFLPSTNGEGFEAAKEAVRATLNELPRESRMDIGSGQRTGASDLATLFSTHVWPTPSGSAVCDGDVMRRRRWIWRWDGNRRRKSKPLAVRFWDCHNRSGGLFDARVLFISVWQCRPESSWPDWSSLSRPFMSSLWPRVLFNPSRAILFCWSALTTLAVSSPNIAIVCWYVFLFSSAAFLALWGEGLRS